MGAVHVVVLDTLDVIERKARTLGDFLDAEAQPFASLPQCCRNPEDFPEFLDPSASTWTRQLGSVDLGLQVVDLLDLVHVPKSRTPVNDYEIANL